MSHFADAVTGSRQRPSVDTGSMERGAVTRSDLRSPMIRTVEFVTIHPDPGYSNDTDAESQSSVSSCSR